MDQSLIRAIIVSTMLIALLILAAFASAHRAGAGWSFAPHQVALGLKTTF